MIVLAGVVTFTVAQFVEREVPYVHVAGVNRLTGEAETNYRQADIDGDGYVDLVVGPVVLFQREGAFSQTDMAPLPRVEANAAYDLWGTLIFYRWPGNLAAYQWDGSAWATVFHAMASWPDDEDAAPHHLPAGAYHARFVHDLNQDGIPEVVIPHRLGVYVYQRQGDAVSLDSVLEVYPRSRYAEGASSRQGLRALTFPARRMDCRVWLDKDVVSVLSWTPQGGERLFSGKSYRVSLGVGISEELPLRTPIQPLPAYAEPVQLNADGVIDFAGSFWNFEETPLLAMPVLETSAWISGGEMKRVRTHGFPPLCSFTDYNADGLLDMVTEHSHLADGGVRESVVRFLSQKRVEHEVRVYLQAEAGFAASYVAHSIQIEFPRLPPHGGLFLRRYQQGGLVNVTGDVDGDGENDIVAQFRTDRIAVYPKREARAAAELPFHEDWSFGVVDLNGDGRSDIVVERSNTGTDGQSPPALVYFSVAGSE